MNVLTVRDALLSVLDGRVYHYAAPTSRADGRESYAVWGETGVTSYNADDYFAEWAAEGMIYFYTPSEYDADFDALCAALDDAGVAVRPGRIAYDEDADMIAYEVSWSVPVAPGGLYREAEDDE